MVSRIGPCTPPSWRIHRSTNTSLITDHRIRFWVEVSLVSLELWYCQFQATSLTRLVEPRGTLDATACDVLENRQVQPQTTNEKVIETKLAWKLGGVDGWAHICLARIGLTRVLAKSIRYLVNHFSEMPVFNIWLTNMTQDLWIF